MANVENTIRLFVRYLDESINNEAFARTVIENVVKRLKKDKRLAAFPDMQKKIVTIEKLLEKIEKFEHRHDILRILNEIADFYESIDSPMAYLDALEREYGLKFENTRKLIERGFVPGVDVRRQISFAVLQDLRGNKELMKRFGKIVDGLMSYYQ